MFFHAPKNVAHQLGKDGEARAKKYLKKSGYKVIESNYRNAMGELDLIVAKDEFLVFVEVKTRMDLNPLLQMTKAKTERIRRLAMAYIQIKDLHRLQPRFDVIAITKQGSQWSLEHIENAF